MQRAREILHANGCEIENENEQQDYHRQRNVHHAHVPHNVASQVPVLRDQVQWPYESSHPRIGAIRRLDADVKYSDNGEAKLKVPGQAAISIKCEVLIPDDLNEQQHNEAGDFEGPGGGGPENRHVVPASDPSILVVALVSLELPVFPLRVLALLLNDFEAESWLLELGHSYVDDYQNKP